VTETGRLPATPAETAAARRTRLGGYALCVEDDRILLSRLSVVELEVGAWTLPGGGVDFGEHPDLTVTRELEEETGLVGEIDRIAGIFSHVYPRSPAAEGGDLHFIGIVYWIRIRGGELRDEVGGSTDRAAWFRRSELAALPLVEIARFGIGLAFGGSSR
jgi:8-oxo-dGTP diphosphatase